jgi:predicted RNA-binding protein associated with RNAse of E/G family
LQKLIVYKLDHTGREVWNYPGKVIIRDKDKVVIEARFTKPDFVFNGMVLKQNDKFIEAYFRKKWYNIFEIYDRDDGRLKGWYCNITRPARFSRWKIAYQDLALDLLVHYQGSSILLDEDEFAGLGLPGQEIKQAWTAVTELRNIFKDQKFRLDTIN